jgi:uncharacterized protein YjiS (DUF1127 family)
MLRSFRLPSSLLPSVPRRRVRWQLFSLWLKLETALEVRRERRALADLDGRALKDIGLNRADVDRETRRALWDFPSDRLF